MKNQNHTSLADLSPKAQAQAVKQIGGKSIFSRAKGHKYNAVPTEVDGRKFASNSEAMRYCQLKMMQDARLISDLLLQVPYDLKIGDITIGRWVADFVYMDNTLKRRVVEDRKGFRTPLYRWKKKHFEAQYGIKILET